MSTSYQLIEYPFTSVRLVVEGHHHKLTIWEKCANCGTLIFESKEAAVKILRSIFGDEEDDRCAMRTHFGGAGVGAVVTDRIKDYPDETQLLSEYGEVLTAGEIRARAGHIRQDGMPGELFGYDERS